MSEPQPDMVWEEGKFVGRGKEVRCVSAGEVDACGADVCVEDCVADEDFDLK